jgi:hypothetical protein
MALLLSMCSFARVPARDRFDDATRWAGGAHRLSLRLLVSLRFHALQGSKNVSQAPMAHGFSNSGRISMVGTEKSRAPAGISTVCPPFSPRPYSAGTGPQM